MIAPFSPNDVLLDQTMLCEASRLLEGCPEGRPFADYLERFTVKSPSGRRSLEYLCHSNYETALNPQDCLVPNNIERLFNLSMLLDALALHDRVYLLKAELPPDASHLRLRQMLLEKDIIRQLDTNYYLPNIKDEFDEFLSKLLTSKQIPYALGSPEKIG